MDERTLFMVGSPYQLFNAIILRMSECVDAVCDVILRPETEWDEEMVVRLKASGIFTTVYFMEKNENISKFWYLDLVRRIELVDDPMSFFGCVPVALDYDKLFVAVPHVEWKLIYRLHVMNGKTPEVCMFDEGLRAYTMDIPKTDEDSCFKGKYTEAPFVKAISTFYLHQPKLYSVGQYEYELKEIADPSESPEIKEKLIEIYGRMDLPKEKFIFIEDYYFADRHLTNDLELFLQVAEIVGKENIIVKRHPRCKEDRFTPLGFKVVDGTKVPWEIQLMTNDLSDKVLISVTSTAILTPFIIFNTPVQVVSLKDMLIGKAFAHTDIGFEQFFTKVAESVNEREVYFHLPSSVEELVETIRYVKLIHTKDID